MKGSLLGLIGVIVLLVAGWSCASWNVKERRPERGAYLRRSWMYRPYFVRAWAIRGHPLAQVVLPYFVRACARKLAALLCGLVQKFLRACGLLKIATEIHFLKDRVAAFDFFE